LGGNSTGDRCTGAREGAVVLELRPFLRRTIQHQIIPATQPINTTPPPTEIPIIAPLLRTGADAEVLEDEVVPVGAVKGVVG